MNDPQLKEIALKQQATIDEEERRALFHEAQKINGVQMYYVPNQAGAGTTWTAYQPWVRNGVEYATIGYGGAAEVLPFYWKDI